MEVFAFVMLILLLIGWHHFVNWYLRMVYKDDPYESGLPIFIVIIVTIALTIIGGYFIIKWGANLI